MATPKKQTKPIHLTLHELIGALSFWGATVRFLLFVFLATVTLFVALSQTVDSYEQIGMYIYILSAFLVFDVGYVMLARGLPLTRAYDIAVIIGFEIILAIAYVLPYFALVPASFSLVVIWSLLIVVGLLSVRALLGLLYSRSS